MIWPAVNPELLFVKPLGGHKPGIRAIDPAFSPLESFSNRIPDHSECLGHVIGLVTFAVLNDEVDGLLVLPVNLASQLVYVVTDFRHDVPPYRGGVLTQ